MGSATLSDEDIARLPRLQSYYEQVFAVVRYILEEAGKDSRFITPPISRLASTYQHGPNPSFCTIPDDGSLCIAYGSSPDALLTPLGRVDVHSGLVAGPGALSDLKSKLTETLGLVTLREGTDDQPPIYAITKAPEGRTFTTPQTFEALHRPHTLTAWRYAQALWQNVRPPSMELSGAATVGGESREAKVQ